MRRVGEKLGRILDAAAPTLALWRAWTAKETAFKIASKLRELGVRPYGVVRIDSACGVTDWSADPDGNQRRIAETFAEACNVAAAFGVGAGKVGATGGALLVAGFATGACGWEREIAMIPAAVGTLTGGEERGQRGGTLEAKLWAFIASTR